MSQWVKSVVSGGQADVRCYPQSDRKSDMVEGAGNPLPPPCRAASDFDLLRYGKSVINIDAKVSHSALNLGVAKQKLDCP